MAKWRVTQLPLYLLGQFLTIKERSNSSATHMKRAPRVTFSKAAATIVVIKTTMPQEDMRTVYSIQWLQPISGARGVKRRGRRA